MLEKNAQLFYCYCKLLNTKKKKIIHFTRLPIQNETSETIVQNSSGLFPYIYRFPATVNIFLSLPNHLFGHKMIIFKAEDLI